MTSKHGARARRDFRRGRPAPTHNRAIRTDSAGELIRSGSNLHELAGGGLFIHSGAAAPAVDRAIDPNLPRRRRPSARTRMRSPLQPGQNPRCPCSATRRCRLPSTQHSRSRQECIPQASLRQCGRLPGPRQQQGCLPNQQADRADTRRKRRERTVAKSRWLTETHNVKVPLWQSCGPERDEPTPVSAFAATWIVGNPFAPPTRALIRALAYRGT